MSAKVFQNGDRVDYTPSGAVTAGTVVMANATHILGVATADMPASVPGSLHCEHGTIYEVSETIAGAAVGLPVYADSTGALTATATSNTLFGHVVGLLPTIVRAVFMLALMFGLAELASAQRIAVQIGRNGVQQGGFSRASGNANNDFSTTARRGSNIGARGYCDETGCYRASSNATVQNFVRSQYDVQYGVEMIQGTELVEETVMVPETTEVEKTIQVPVTTMVDKVIKVQQTKMVPTVRTVERAVFVPQIVERVREVECNCVATDSFAVRSSGYDAALASATYRAANGIRGHSYLDSGAYVRGGSGVGWTSNFSEMMPNTCLGRGGENYAVSIGRDGVYATKFRDGAGVDGYGIPGATRGEDRRILRRVFGIFRR